MLLVAAGCSLIGTAALTWKVWWKLRIARLAVAALVGAALAASGLALQGMLRNPLAEPYILGISTGAGVGMLGATLLATYVVFLLPGWASRPSRCLAHWPPAWLSTPSRSDAAASIHTPSSLPE